MIFDSVFQIRFKFLDKDINWFEVWAIEGFSVAFGVTSRGVAQRKGVTS